MPFGSMRDVIGRTPLVRLRFDAPVEVYAKLELLNPFGMKDRVARNVILEATRIGALRPGDPIVESSSGTMALGVALVGRSLGHEVHIVTDPRIDRITMAKLRALGCRVHVVDAMTANGWQSARIERLRQLLDELPGAFWPQQYGNPDNPAAYRELAEEILDDLGPFDVLVGSVGSGGSLTGSARALRVSLPGLRVVGVDCVGSALFDQPDVPQRLQGGLGNSLLPHNLDRRWLTRCTGSTTTRRSPPPGRWHGNSRSSRATRPVRCTECWATSPRAPSLASALSASSRTGEIATPTRSTATITGRRTGSRTCRFPLPRSRSTTAPW